MKERGLLAGSSRTESGQAEALAPPAPPSQVPKRLALAAVYVGLIALLGLFGYRYWLAPGHGRQEMARLQSQVAAQRIENTQLEGRNKTLERDIASLRHGGEALQERARYELGMIGKNETFVQLVGRSAAPKSP